LIVKTAGTGLEGEDEIMGRMARRVAALAGGAAIVTMVGLTASCAKEEQKAPETSTTTMTTTTTTTTTPSAPPSVAPTEKSMNPTGGNLFTPTVKAPPAPTAIPGDH
jgi:flagellar basal body L-ring protein FlgH